MRHAKVCIAVLTLFLALSSTASSSSDSSQEAFVPHYKPTLTVKAAPGPIKVDGELNDRGWYGAQPAKDFTEHSPGDEVKPPVRTEAFITYDDKNLYLAAVCYADSGTVRATMCERERIFNDDNIGFFFDTYGDASRAYVINLNPYGIPYDALWSPGWGEDGNFDLIFESSGIITDSGYQVEMAIPFASLRFPGRPVQEWRFDFYRHHMREVHYSMSWATYDKNESCWPCKWGTVYGIENVEPGRGLELLPSFVAHQSGSVTDEAAPDESFANGDIYGDLSIGGKYALSSDVIVEAAYNPDFSQIEADASQVDVNTTYALSYEEKRPFFQESIDLFRTCFNAVYTRSINDPDFAAKASARFGKTSIAFLSAHDENTLGILPFEERSAYVPLGRTYTNMLAVRQPFGQSNHVRAVVTDQRVDGGGSGTLASFDAQLYLTRTLSLSSQFIATYTEEPNDTTMTSGLLDTLMLADDEHTAEFDGESFWGSAVLVGVEYAPRNAYSYTSVYQRTAGYRAANGFQPRNNDRRIISTNQYIIRPQGSIFHYIEPGFEIARIYNFDGVRKDEWLSLQCHAGLRFAQISLYSQYLLSRERLGGIDFRNIRQFTFQTTACPTGSVELGMNVAHGNLIARNYLAMGRQTDVTSWAEFRPTGRLLIVPQIIYTVSHDIDTHERYFEGFIAYTRVSYQFNRELSLRLVGEYNDFSEQWSIDPLVTYRINAFSTVYAGATYDYFRFNECGLDLTNSLTCLAQRQFFLKIQYLFQT